MSFLPRAEILARLEVSIGHPLIAPERIEEADLQAMYGYILDLQGALEDSEEECQDWRDGMPAYDAEPSEDS